MIKECRSPDGYAALDAGEARQSRSPDRVRSSEAAVAHLLQHRVDLAHRERAILELPHLLTKSVKVILLPLRDRIFETDGLIMSPLPTKDP